MIVGENANEPKYNVLVNGVLMKEAVAKFIAEQYVCTLSEEDQKQTKLVPVTSEGKEILFG